jgi:hypothetical protein
MLIWLELVESSFRPAQFSKDDTIRGLKHASTKNLKECSAIPCVVVSLCHARAGSVLMMIKSDTHDMTSPLFGGITGWNHLTAAKQVARRQKQLLFGAVAVGFGLVARFIGQ